RLRMRRQRGARRHRVPLDLPRGPRGGRRRGEARGLDRGAHDDAPLRGEDADRKLLRLLRAARRFPAHARALHGRQAPPRRAHHPALRHRGGAAGVRGPGVGPQRARRHRVRAGGLATSMAERILVVDDQRVNGELIGGLLRNLGYEVHAVLDGESALEYVAVHPVDLVISDIVMPGMDGYELCRRLRATSRTALLPVVLVTSLDPQVERVKGIEAGADDFLSKPVNWAELFARVKRLLRVKALQDEIKTLNARLEERVRGQVAQLQRLSRLK